MNEENRINVMAYQFEEIMINAINHYCLNNGKIILTNYLIDKKLSVDAYAPSGFMDDNPTFIEIKYLKQTENLYFSIKKFVSNLTNDLYFSKKGCRVIFITLIKRINIELIINQIGKIPNITIEIWDYYKTVDFLNKYRFELNALINEGIIDNENIDDQLNIDLDIINEKSKIHAKTLKEIIKRKKISLVIGTGLSLEYGCPSWNELAKNLYEYIEDKFLDKDKSFQKIGGDNLCITQFVKQELNNISDHKYLKTLKNELYRNYKEHTYFNTTLMSTSDLIYNSYVKKVITYNYDNHLENELERRHIDYSLMISKDDYVRNELPIYHVHGYLPNTKLIDTNFINNIILTEDDYFNLYRDSNNWQVAIQLQTFKDDICLFVGNSITDYNEKRLLNETRQKLKHHYAIMFKDGLEVEDLNKITKYFLLTYNVDIIWVNNKQEYIFLISYLNA